MPWYGLKVIIIVGLFGPPRSGVKVIGRGVLNLVKEVMSIKT